MKQYFSTALALVCIVLVAALILVKRSDDEQHQTDTGSITDFSNQLWSAQTQIAIGRGTILTLSNNLDEARSAFLTFSNQLTDAQAGLARDAEKITGLTQQVADLKSQNEAESETSSQRIMELTNQTASLTMRLAETETNLAAADKNYLLLENRFRRDVAERVVMDRKFNNPAELQAQMDRLKKHPAEAISVESIYAGLDVEVNSNGSFHVLSEN